MQKTPLILGSHLSVSGGLDQAIIRAQSLGCNAVQFFSKSNRQWYAKPLNEYEITLFKETLKQSSVLSTTVHASYLINIGSPDPTTASKSRDALADEYARACALGVDHLVFHPGSHLKDGEPACLERIAQHINSILSNTSEASTKLVLETMAGQGSGICYTFEQLAYIIERIQNKDRIGVCLDTCHVFAAGYDLANDYKGVMNRFDSVIGLSYLNVIHINDSKKELGSRVDRHEHLGLGKIGLEAFRQLFNDPRLFRISKILETPKESDLDDLRNIEIIRGLIQ